MAAPTDATYEDEYHARLVTIEKEIQAIKNQLCTTCDHARCFPDSARTYCRLWSSPPYHYVSCALILGCWKWENCQ